MAATETWRCYATTRRAPTTSSSRSPPPSVTAMTTTRECATNVISQIVSKTLVKNMQNTVAVYFMAGCFDIVISLLSSLFKATRRKLKRKRIKQSLTPQQQCRKHRQRSSIKSVPTCKTLSAARKPETRLPRRRRVEHFHCSQLLMPVRTRVKGNVSEYE